MATNQAGRVSMASKSTQTAPTDRREWLRIDDRLPLEYRPIDAAAAAPLPAVNPDALTSLQEFLNKPTQDLLGTLKPDDPQAALVPWMLKMDWVLGVMLGTLARMAPGGLTIPRMTNVNISATGMSFPAAQFFESGVELEVRLILPPFMPVTTKVEVVRTTSVADSADSPYLVAVTFVEMRTDDQEYLIRHILHLQAEQLRLRQREIGR